MHPECDFQNCSKLAINSKNHNDVPICWHDLIVTGSIFMSISLPVLDLWLVLWGIDQKSGNWKYHRLSFGDGLVRDTKLDTNVSNEMLLNAAKCHGYSFYRFLVIMVKTTRLNANSPKVKQQKKHFQILIKR